MKISDLYKNRQPVVSLEVFPPKKDIEVDSLALTDMCALKPDFISVTFGAGGEGSQNRTAELASFIRSEGTESLAHLTCVGADRERIKNILDELASDGIENVLALRGDLPENECVNDEYRYATDLIRDIRERGDFCVGAACYPEGHIECEEDELDIKRMLMKQEAGADFLISQLFFDNDIFFRFMERSVKTGLRIPVSAGVMPILSLSQIERMVFMCGVSLPSSIVKLLHRYEGSVSDLRKAGIEFASEQLYGLIKRGAEGVHIYTMNSAEVARQCMGYINERR